MKQAKKLKQPIFSAVSVVILILSSSVYGATYELYHGTDYNQAIFLRDREITPQLLQPLSQPLTVIGSGYWSDFTDFGKGFYTHPQKQKTLAISWAKEKALALCKKNKSEKEKWGVLVFMVDPYELRKIRQQAPNKILQFFDKKHRPENSPLIKGRVMSWLEFVEYNRHIPTTINKEHDYDWSNRYWWIQGPFWVPKDSGIDVGGPIMAKENQINWLDYGIKKVINNPKFKRRVDYGSINCPVTSIGKKDGERTLLEQCGIKKRIAGFFIPTCPEIQEMKVTATKCESFFTSGKFEPHMKYIDYWVSKSCSQ